MRTLQFQILIRESRFHQEIIRQCESQIFSSSFFLFQISDFAR